MTFFPHKLHGMITYVYMYSVVADDVLMFAHIHYVIWQSNGIALL